MTYKQWQQAFVAGDKSGLREIGIGDKINPMNITNEWTKNTGIEGSVIERQEYTVNGTIYRVDGKHVVLRPTDQEMTVANVLSAKYGKTVEVVPQVMYPQGIQTPDYLIGGERFDLKSLMNAGKNVVYNMVSKKKTQSSNFILDITNCPLQVNEIERQIAGLYASTHTKFVEKIVVFKGNAIIRVYKRQ